MAFAILILTACADKECKPVIETRYIDRIIEKKVPVVVEAAVSNDANCDSNRSTYTGIISGMLECIIDRSY